MTFSQSRGGTTVRLILWSGMAVLLLFVLNHSFAGLAPLGGLLDPADGLYRTARHADHLPMQTLTMAGLEGVVTILRDERGVPHIFAESDQDAVIALGYVTAQDRLFELDFIPRVAAGKLSEIFGAASVPTDRFLRQTGMEWGARKNAAFIREQGGVDYDLARWYALGVNAYLDALDTADLPFEFKLFGYRPERYSVLQMSRLMQYFAYDLTYRSDAAYYATLKTRLGPAAYARLYPRNEPVYVPIIPEQGGGAVTPSRISIETQPAEVGAIPPAARSALARLAAMQLRAGDLGAEGFVPGKGSNNWVVAGAHSATGAPILAGDMHLRLSLPAIWYEVHLVTPTMNTYGVTAPGAPVPMEAFNDYVAWAYTNTGADVIDHYALELDATGTRYRYEDGWRDLELVPDTIYVKGEAPVIDTLRYAHWGPVVMDGDGAVATHWTAHDPNRTLQAVWGMNHARTLAEFNAALQRWDTPMQNIVYADVEGNIAIRSTGYLPLRKAGDGAGLLDGSTDAYAWTGRVPFDDLPHSINPAQGFLSSTNQQPADSTYPYYLGHDWRSAYRSLRIDSLLRGKATHTVDDFKRYQADVHAVQRDLFVPLLDTLAGLSSEADTLRQMLTAWSGDTGTDRPEPLAFDEFLRILGVMTWDEPAFDGVRNPSETVLYTLLRDDPDAEWLDVQSTTAREDAAGLLRYVLEATADTMAARYGWDRKVWRWGDHHHIVFRHLTQTPALQALWRGPFEYPGFAETLSPASGGVTTHSASWRVVVDLSQTPPVGYGMYPGGESGNPFSAFYDLQVAPYVHFQHYDLYKPATPDAFAPDRISSRMMLHP